MLNNFGQVRTLERVLQQVERELHEIRSYPSFSIAGKRPQIVERQARAISQALKRFDAEIVAASHEVSRALNAVHFASGTSDKLESTGTFRGNHGSRASVVALPSFPISLLREFLLTMDALCAWQERHVLSNSSRVAFPSPRVSVVGNFVEVETFDAYLKRLTRALS